MTMKQLSTGGNVARTRAPLIRSIRGAGRVGYGLDPSLDQDSDPIQIVHETRTYAEESRTGCADPGRSTPSSTHHAQIHHGSSLDRIWVEKVAA